jgi:hypothetical protein
MDWDIRDLTPKCLVIANAFSKNQFIFNEFRHGIRLSKVEHRLRFWPEKLYRRDR